MSNPSWLTSTLAINGGERVRSTAFAPWPWFDDEVIEAAVRTLRSGKVSYWTGNEGRQFEKEYAASLGCRHAIVVANGTVALELALYALGIGPGDEVLVASRTFIASASCIVMRGATPVMADVDRDSQNITAAALRAAITPRTKAIIAVHLAGWPCDMDAILTAAREHGLKVVEDCAQAHGAQYKGRPVGSMGHINAFSFCEDKILTLGGEGGLVTSNDTELWSSAWAFKDHGKSYEAVYERQHAPGFRWLHESFGTNWRMLEMQAAIGRVQLRHMANWTATRTRNAEAIWAACRPHAAVRVPTPARELAHAHYKSYVYANPHRLAPGWSRDKIIDAINAQGVPCYQGSCSEVYLEKAFDNTDFRPVERLAVARQLGETSLMFLVHPTLTAKEIDKTCTVVDDVLRRASA